jgi:hypothetical protein
MERVFSIELESGTPENKKMDTSSPPFCSHCLSLIVPLSLNTDQVFLILLISFLILG